MKVDAFTRVELLVVLATVGFVSLLGLSVNADTRERSERMVCMNNLRQIGRALHTWAAEHGGENAWWVRPSEGGYRQAAAAAVPGLHVPGVGTFPAAIMNNTWFHFLWVHEELPSPNVLLCPNDTSKRRASGFSSAPGGLAHLSMQNNAVSYLIGADAMREYPWAILSADRNLVSDLGGPTCSTGITTVRYIRAPYAGGRTAWTNTLHQTSGQVLMNDGQVNSMSTRELNEAIAATDRDDNGIYHVLLP